MKKIISIGIIGMFLLTSFSVFVVAEKQSGSDQIFMSYSFETPVITDVDINAIVYDQIAIEGAPCSGNPGEPNLPGKGSYILLPPNSKVSNIVVNPGQIVSLGSGYLVEPAGEPVPLSDIDNASIPVPDEEIYSSTDVFPGKLYTEVGTYRCRGYDILVLMLHPVQYIPASGELYYYPDLSISIETAKDDNSNSLFHGLEKDKQEIMNKVENPAMLDSYDLNTQQQTIAGQSSDPLGYDLLIITSEALKDGFEPLKQAHDSEGLKTLIYTVDDIVNNSAYWVNGTWGDNNPDNPFYNSPIKDNYKRFERFNDTQAKIRNFIRHVFTESRIEYVLLGGDHNIVPARWLKNWNGLGLGTTSDLYYGCLDGNFNFDNDDFSWGEPCDGSDVDLLTEVYVGRACAKNLIEVSNFVNKTIKYMNIDSSDQYLKKAVIAGEFLGFLPPWGGVYMDELINKCRRHGYTTVGIPSKACDITKLYDKDWWKNGWPRPKFNPFSSSTGGWPKDEIISRISNGVHIINHLGHSYYDYNLKMYIEDVINLTNNKLCFIYSQGCLAGGFDRNCIAEYFTVKTEHGAFAGIWNSNVGLGSIINTDSASQRYNREFWDAVFRENITIISKANQDSKEDNLWRIDQTPMRDVYYELNLFGDPAVQFKYLDSSLINTNSQSSQQQLLEQQSNSQISSLSNLQSSPSSQTQGLSTSSDSQDNPNSS